MKARPRHEIPIAELKSKKVWEFSGDARPGEDESWIVPVEELPVSDLGSRIVATDVMLSNRSTVTGVLQCIELNDPRRTEEFITLSIERDGNWFHLARYFDPWNTLTGPVELATFLGLDVDDIFPISYDISDVAIGAEEAVKGIICAEPRERLTKEERKARFPIR